MHEEGVEHTKYEETSVRQINLDSQYDCLSTINKLSLLVSFGHNDTSVQMSGENN